MLAAGGGQKIVVLLNILFASLGNGAMYSKNPVYSQVQFYTATNNILLSPQILMDTIALPFNLERVRVRTREPRDDAHQHPHHQLHYYMREELTTTTTLVQMREGLAIMPLATIPTNVKKDDDTTTVLTSRMDPTIATVWMKKLRQRGLIWPVFQSP